MLTHKHAAARPGKGVCFRDVGPETEAYAAPTGETIRCRNEHGEHYMTDILQLC
jgi:hypothetical protein